MMHGFEKAIFANGMTERLNRDLEHARDLTRECVVLPFNQQAAEIAAYIFPRLTRKERKDHWPDALIAATVVAHEYGIATLNRTDFEMLARHIPPAYAPLRIELWK